MAVSRALRNLSEFPGPRDCGLSLARGGCVAVVEGEGTGRSSIGASIMLGDLQTSSEPVCISFSYRGVPSISQLLQTSEGEEAVLDCKSWCGWVVIANSS